MSEYDVLFQKVYNVCHPKPKGLFFKFFPGVQDISDQTPITTFVDNNYYFDNKTFTCMYMILILSFVNIGYSWYIVQLYSAMSLPTLLCLSTTRKINFTNLGSPTAYRVV